LDKEEARPGQMQAPDFTTSAFKSSMVLKLVRRGNDSDDELRSTAAELHCEMSASLAARQQQLHCTYHCE